MVADSDSGAPETGTEILPERPAHLFTSETARAASLKAREVRRSRLATLKLEQLIPLLDELGDCRPDLRDAAFTGAYVLVGRLASGQVGDRHVHYVAQAIEKLVNVGRLESGEATSHSLSVTAGADDFRQWIEAQRGQVTAASALPAPSQPHDSE